MKVSVIVCTYSLDLLPDTVACINSLVELSYESKEILLVMDRNDRLFQALRSSVPPSVKILINERPGLSEARNTGISHAKGDILVFIDDDAIADRDYLSNLVKNYEDEMVIGVGGKILPKERPSYPEELYWIGGFTYKGYPEERCSVRNVHGCNMSFRRDVFDKVGLFDTKLGRIGRKLVTAEETEFCMRALSAFPNCKIVYDPLAVVHHKNHRYRQSFRYLIKRAYYEGQSKANIERMYNKSKLSTENSYLGYLLKIAIPMRIDDILYFKNMMINIRDTFLLSTVILTVGLGYISGKIK
ncbi:MAG: Glycosyltransferase AglG [Methanosaeta sp. PtaB.Bin018]|nr:MAG: Glycosyltransferase AglG [Methanosaeta sp. PtaB.Bin018]